MADLGEVCDAIELARAHGYYCEPMATVLALLGDRDEKIAKLEQALTAAEAERDEMQRVFDLRNAADRRAREMWRADGGDELTWPNHADLVVWLLGQLDAATACGDDEEAAHAETLAALTAAEARAADILTRVETHANILDRESRELEAEDEQAAYDRQVSANEIRYLLRELRRTLLPTASDDPPPVPALGDGGGR